MTKRKVNLRVLYNNLNMLKVVYSRYLVNATLDGVNKKPTVLDVNYDFLVDLGRLDSLVVSKSFKRFDSAYMRYAGDYIANSLHLQYVLRTQKIESKTLRDALQKIKELLEILEVIDEYESFLLKSRGSEYNRSAAYQMGVKLLSDAHIGFQNQLPQTTSFLSGGVKREAHSLGSVYYNVLTEWFYQVMSIADYESWTFHEGFTREEELEYLPLFLEGVVEPTTSIGKYIIKSLWANEDELSNQKHSLKQLYKETLQDRLGRVSSVNDNLKEGIVIVGCDDYNVYTLDIGKSGYGSDRVPSYKSTYGSFVYLEDTGNVLSDLEIIGVGGSFKLEMDDTTFSIPTELIIDGEFVDGYMLKSGSSLDSESLDYLLLSNDIGVVEESKNACVRALLNAYEGLDVDYITLGNTLKSRVNAGEKVLGAYQEYILEFY